jgi:hypothetical protein
LRDDEVAVVEGIARDAFEDSKTSQPPSLLHGPRWWAV